MSSISQVLPLKNSNLWKGVGVGIGLCVLTLAIVIPNLMRTKTSAYHMAPYIEREYAKVAGGGGGGGNSIVTAIAEADGPKIVRTAEMNLLVSDCGATLKKVEWLAAAENGLIEPPRWRRARPASLCACPPRDWMMCGRSCGISPPA